MKFKRSTKKESPKKDAVSEEKVSQDALTKEEIKELVEETVDEALKEKEEKQPEVIEEETPSSPETPTIEEPSVEEPEENKEDDKIVTTESTPNETSEITSDLSPVDEKAPESMNVASDQSQEDKTISSSNPTATTTPIISVSGVTPESGGTVTANKNEKSPNKKSPLILLFIVFVICGFVVGISILSLLSKNNFKFSSLTSIIKHTPTPTPTTAPTPTQEPVNMAKYKISVLNGSGVAGAAAAAKSDLTSAGFTVISTGNASSNTTQTTVSVKSSVDQATLEKLLQTLAEKYTVSSHTESLSNSDTADIVVTVGTAK